MTQRISFLQGEIAPGVFLQEKLAELPENKAFKCASFDQGTGALVEDAPTASDAASTFMRVSGDHLGTFTANNERRKAVRDELFDHPRRYGGPDNDTTTIAHLLYHDGKYSGLTGEYEKAATSAGNIGDHWNNTAQTEEERGKDVDVFLKPSVWRIKGSEEIFSDLRVEDPKLAIAGLKHIEKKLRIKEVTARRMQVMRAGPYIASRRGSLWIGINTSRMSDMPVFEGTAPLAGLGIQPIAHQHKVSEGIRQVLPVVLGKDSLPYLLSEKGQRLFTLCPDTRGSVNEHGTSKPVGT